MPSAVIFLFPGAEEMETVITADVLKRGGFDVTIASEDMTQGNVCSRGVILNAHANITDVAAKNFDIAIVPGGLKGVDNASACSLVGEMLRAQEARKGWIAAICAGPLALKAHGICKSATLTSYPGVKEKLLEAYKYSEERVHVDDRLITSRGPGTACEFALKIVSLLVSPEKAAEISGQMLVK